MVLRVLQTSNGIMPELYGTTRGVRQSMSFAIELNGPELQAFQKLASGYGGIDDLIQDVLRDYLRPEPVHGISPEAISHQDHELTGRLPL